MYTIYYILNDRIDILKCDFDILAYNIATLKQNEAKILCIKDPCGEYFPC